MRSSCVGYHIRYFEEDVVRCICGGCESSTPISCQKVQANVPSGVSGTKEQLQCLRPPRNEKSSDHSHVSLYRMHGSVATTLIPKTMRICVTAKNKLKLDVRVFFTIPHRHGLISKTMGLFTDHSEYKRETSMV